MFFVSPLFIYREIPQRAASGVGLEAKNVLLNNDSVFKINSKRCDQRKVKCKLQATISLCSMTNTQIAAQLCCFSSASSLPSSALST